MTAEKAKTFTCIEFAEAGGRDLEFDMIVAGDNGIVYKFRQAVCILAVSVSSGPVSSLVVCGGQLLVGAALGLVKVLDRRDFSEVNSYSVHPADMSPAASGSAAGRPGSAAHGGRPASSSGGRPASAGPRGRPSSGAAAGKAGAVIDTGVRAAGGAGGSNKDSQMARKGRVVRSKAAVAQAWQGPSSGFVKGVYNPPPPPDGIKACSAVLGVVPEYGQVSSECWIADNIWVLHVL